MAKPEAAVAPIPRAAFTVKEFCVAHGISPSTYYGLKARGLGPREINAGRTLVSFEAAAEWRRARETETETT
jgi:hypothetical protein